MAIMGDLNSSMFSLPAAEFFVRMQDPKGDWRILADESYLPTRLGGVPLQPKSHLDYIIVSSGELGLWGNEVSVVSATVHDTGSDDYESFRATYSDHRPVTVGIAIQQDSD